MQLIKNFIAIALLVSPYLADAQSGENRNFDRFTADSINGVYIPENIYDAMLQIDGFWSDSVKQVVREMSVGQFTAGAHMGFGMWIRNNWQLWGGSRLSKYMTNQAGAHPDDMSDIILRSYYKYLTGDKELAEQVELYRKSKQNPGKRKKRNKQ